MIDDALHDGQAGEELDERSESGGRGPDGSAGGEGDPPLSIDERSESGGRGPDGSAGGEGDPPLSIDDAIVARVSDYLDGALTGTERAEVAGKIASDATWKRAHDELTETRSYLSGLRKAHAPPSFADHVTETIHQRSAGRLFARKTLGDRVPFGLLLVVALAGLLVIGYVLWSSTTGSLKVDRAHDRPAAAGSSAVAPP